MEIVNKLRLFIEGLERKDFFKYLIVVLVSIVLLTGGILFWHYKRIDSLRSTLEEVNDTREQMVLPILQRMNKVRLQRKQVNDILAKEEDFKIGAYLNKLLSSLNLTVVSTSPSTADLGNNYREVVRRVRLNDMDMKQLCEFLEKIEKNERSQLEFNVE